MKPRFVEDLFVLIICASSLCLAADAGSEDVPGIRESPCVYQCRSRTTPTGQGTRSILRERIGDSALTHKR